MGHLHKINRDFDGRQKNTFGCLACTDRPSDRWSRKELQYFGSWHRWRRFRCSYLCSDCSEWHILGNACQSCIKVFLKKNGKRMETGLWHILWGVRMFFKRCNFCASRSVQHDTLTRHHVTTNGPGADNGRTDASNGRLCHGKPCNIQRISD